MATTIKQIAQYLDSHNWKYELDTESDRILTGVKALNVEKFLIIINLTENGEYFCITAPQILSLKDHIYKEILFQTLLALSWENKMVRWQYDLMDGEIRAAIEFPLEDNRISKTQFDRCLHSLIEFVDSVAMPRLLAVLKTGIDPKEEELGERLLLTLEETLPEGALTLLEQAIFARKQRRIS